MGLESSLTGVPQFDNVEIIATSSLTLTRPTSTRTVIETYTHNLGFIPLVIAAVEISDVRYAMPYLDIDPNAGATDGMVRKQLTWSVDSTTLTFTLEAYGSYMTSASDSMPVRFYLLRTRAK